MVVCPILLLGSCYKQCCGALRELVAGRASVKHFQRDGNVENTVPLSESSTGTSERSSQRANRKVHSVRLVRIRVPAVCQLQEGVYGALAEVVASRPNVGKRSRRTPSFSPEPSTPCFMRGCSRNMAIASAGSALIHRCDSFKRIAAVGSCFARAARVRYPRWRADQYSPIGLGPGITGGG